MKTGNSYALEPSNWAAFGVSVVVVPLQVFVVLIHARYHIHFLSNSNSRIILHHKVSVLLTNKLSGS